MKAIIILNIFLIATGFAQSDLLKQALIKFDHSDGTPVEIRFGSAKKRISLDAFFHSYRKEFRLAPDITFKTLSTDRDELGQVHYRISQSYKGIDLPQIQMLVHEKDGSVLYAHGKLIHHLDINIIPSQSEQQALQSALNYIDASAYMWENHKNESFIKQLTGDPNASFYPKGKLIITSAPQKMTSENLRLAYRFSIHTRDPYGGYDVDVDADTREIIGVIPFIYSGDVPGEGLSLYNNLVDITVSDTVSESPASPRWHLDSWMALSDSGYSWWMADPSIGPQGGYANKWYEVLDTETLTLSGSDCRLTYYQRYFVEPYQLTNGDFQGFDGCNVRLSADSGATWNILPDPEPAYSCASLAGFGETYGEGPGIPGWSGSNQQWHKVSFDLSAYSGKTVKIRFAFASDYSYATSEGISALFGWQIDDILISNSQDTLFRNSGEAQGMTARNIAKDINIILNGKYRLREKRRGRGIATYNMQNQPEYHLAQDFVDDDSSFTDPYSRAGVSVHWASEAAYEYYVQRHNRLSYDNRNGRIISFAHDGEGYANAFWNAGLQIAGYGDGKLNNAPLVSLDIVGHEITHGVTQFTSNLSYRNESGALNESFSDIFGTMIEFYVEGVRGDWLIGEDFSAAGTALRSFANPAALGHPHTYQGNNWIPEPFSATEENDWGGVHSNCAVQNYWFYLLSEGGSGTNDNGFVYNVTGIGKEAAARISYRNLTDYLMPASTFEDARLGSINATIDLYGDESAQLQAVADAWNAVGVDYPSLVSAIGSSFDTLKFEAEASAGVDSTSLLIYNYGLDTLIITAVQISGTEFTLSAEIDFPIQLNSYEDGKILELIFSPVSEGVKTDSITFYSNDPRHPAYTVYLQGKGWVLHPGKANTMYAMASFSGTDPPRTLIKFDGKSDQWQSIEGMYRAWIEDLALNPLTGILIGLGFNNRIYRIDTESGNMYHLTTLTGSRRFINAIAFDTNGDLYGEAADDLYRIDLETGETLLIGELDSPYSCSCLAINPLNGDLWASGRIFYNEPVLFKINKSNLKPTYIGETELSFTAIAFDAASRFYGLSGNDSLTDLYQIDTLDLSGTLIGSTGYQDISGLVIRGEMLTDIHPDLTPALPLMFGLQQNFPNPFNPLTTIRFTLPKSEFVTLKIFNILGEEIAVAVNENLKAGSHTYSFDGSHLASGIYLYRLEAGKYREVKKMILLK